MHIYIEMLYPPWQTTPASSWFPQLLLSMKLLWEQLNRSVSEPVHWTPLRMGDWESSLNKPLVTAMAPVHVCIEWWIKDQFRSTNSYILYATFGNHMILMD